MTTLNDTMENAVDTAKHTVESARKVTERAASVALADIADGIRVVTGAVALIRSFSMNDALGWIGLERRRSGFESAAIFGSGLLVGAGVGMLLAPMSGSNLRRTIFRRIQGVEKEAEMVAGKVKDAVINAEHKVEDAAGRAKDTVIGAAKDVVEGAEEKVNMVKEAIVGGAKDGDGTEQKANKAKDGADDTEQKTDTISKKTKDAAAAERKAEAASDKAKDAIAGERRNNNGASAEGHHRHAARNQ